MHERKILSCYLHDNKLLTYNMQDSILSFRKLHNAWLLFCKLLDRKFVSCKCAIESYCFENYMKANCYLANLTMANFYEIARQYLVTFYDFLTLQVARQDTALSQIA